MSFVLAIAGLGVLIFVHELGHFVVSLVLGMRPRRFYVGFPPAVWSVKRNGIEYGLGAIPLGGFVKIPGMHRPSVSDVDVAFGPACDEVPSLIGAVARLRQAVRSEDVPASAAALELLARTIEEKELSPPAAKAVARGLEDLGDALGPDAYWRAATWRRVAAIVAGPLANVVLALFLFTGLFMSSGGQSTTTVAHVGADTAAARMGLQAGDRIVSINGKQTDADGIAATIVDSGGAPVSVVVLRGQRTIALPATSPKSDRGTYRLGFRFASEGLGPVPATREGLRLTWDVTSQIGRSIGGLVTGEGRKDISSPVGIVQGSSDAAKEGTTSFLFVLGLISLSIALLNLLPLLPLDGGHIVFAVAEGIRGRVVRREIYERVSVIGIGVVLLLFFIGLSNDISNFS
jgi:regulator of sigma E protease